MAHTYKYTATITVEVRANSEDEAMTRIEEELQNQDKMDVEVQHIMFNDLEETNDPTLLNEFDAPF
jgi:ABC-type metal ion transport system substrate-binding protein